MALAACFLPSLAQDCGGAAFLALAAQLRSKECVGSAPTAP